MWLYTLLLAAAGLSLALIAAPLSFWRKLLELAPVELAVALGGASVAVAGGYLAQGGWNSLSSATLTLSHWLLTLYEPNVILSTEHRVLGAGDFRVQVNGACSGYEGVALLTATISMYVWAFRRDLRFPNVLLLLPVGIAAVWLLNALRISLLVSIGAHVSPTVAIQGFHSAAGWISFLLVTFALIAASRRVAFFAAEPRHASPAIVARTAPSAADPVLHYLAPFIALVATSILASAFAPHDQWLYALKVVAIGSVLWWFRDAYLPLLTGASWSSVGIGLAVGAVWIVTDPDKGAGLPLGAWLATLPLWVAALWLGLRVLGTTVLVPIAEELAFRGYLSRLLISTRFESVPIGEFRPLAFIGSTIAFGMVHQRWLAACLAGAIYALLMYRTKRLSDPIVAHAASNAAIAAWAIAMQQWSLL
jgi:exosortase E/protease (VPEID-CTERM system)